MIDSRQADLITAFADIALCFLIDYETDNKFLCISQAIKRAKHFGSKYQHNCQVIGKHPLPQKFETFELYWTCSEQTYTGEDLYAFQLKLLYWWCSEINSFCNDNKVDCDNTAQKIMSMFVSNPKYFIVDYSKLTALTVPVEEVVDERQELIDIDYKSFEKYYQETIRKIDGFTTAGGYWTNGLVREYDIVINSPVQKNNLKPLFVEYINNPKIERLEIGEPCDFNYDEFMAGKSEYVFLDGKPFKGFYKK